MRFFLFDFFSIFGERRVIGAGDDFSRFAVYDDGFARLNLVCDIVDTDDGRNAVVPRQYDDMARQSSFGERERRNLPLCKGDRIRRRKR